MWLLVGLGNPGKQYQHHRHNVGFMLADRLAEGYGDAGWRKKFSAEHTDIRLAGDKMLLAKPATFMNHSGRAVGQMASYYDIPPEQILVMHDELDLPTGKLRIKQGGGHGGHNGLRDIDCHIGKDYWRLRIGIDHPGDKDQVSNYVLSDFSKADRNLIDPLLDDIARQIKLFFTDGPEAFMSKIALLSGGK